MTKFEITQLEHPELGVVTKFLPGLAFVEGLPQARMGEIVVFENELEGRILAVGKKEIKVMLLGNELLVKTGLLAVRTGDTLKIFAGTHLLGKNVTSLGHLIDHHGPEPTNEGEWRRVETAPLGLQSRTECLDKLDTGVALVDLMVPLAKGQRELIIGDKKTGKTQLATQTMITQARQGSICVYAGIARKQSALFVIQHQMIKAGVADRCIFVMSQLGESPGSIFLTPYTAMAIAEYFRDQGHDVLVIFDNMSLHAEYYREISLLAQSFPGKEAYPGDVFFIHSRLIERGGSFLVKGKRVSLTCLPIAETTEGDLAGYIQTNLMSMTDGHLYFDLDIFLTGRRPAINLLLSVTRVGRQTQSQLEHQLSGKLQELVSEYLKAQGYLRFGAELSGHLQEVLDLGLRLESTLDQLNTELIERPLAITLAGLLWASNWSSEKTSALKKFYSGNASFKKTINQLVENCTTLDELIAELADRHRGWEAVL